MLHVSKPSSNRMLLLKTGATYLQPSAQVRMLEEQHQSSNQPGCWCKIWDAAVGNHVRITPRVAQEAQLQA